MKNQKKRVLVVDDDQGLQSLISEILNMENIPHDIASTGKEAFRFVMQNQYDLILMDIKMPEWDGITAIRSLDFVQKIQKILVISAYLDEEMLKILNKEPLVIGHMEKPFEPSKLIKKLREVLGS